MVRRLAAAAALLALLAAPIAAIAFALAHLPLLVVTLVAVVVAAAAGWVTVTRRGAMRVAGAVLTIAAVVAIVVACFVVLPASRALREVAVIALLLVLATALSRLALGRGAEISTRTGPRTTRAGHPVVFMNPRSGGGKVGRFHLVDEARRRGIEPVVLGPGDDLRALVHDAVARGADALGAAGGDGSQAIVASMAIERGLPYVCIPAGTRNHLALDLGVGRDDVVGALDAFTSGPEMRVDVGFVGDQLFVNNVSFGVYGEVVQSDAYRNAKVQTAAAMLPDLLGPGGRAPQLRFVGPDGSQQSARELILVSNNPYDLSRIGGFGTRPRLDTGTLGIVSVDVADAGDAAKFAALQLAGRVRDFPGCNAWTATTFEVEADQALPVGIDGESVRLDPPVRLRICPGALRVWLAEDAPGATPRRATVGLERSTFTALWDLLRRGAPGDHESRDGGGGPTGDRGSARAPA